MSFVHLHTRSCFSLLGGTATPDDLAAAAARMGQNALGLTDLQSGFGLVPFLRACREHAIKPIVGNDIPVRLPGKNSKSMLTLLAENDRGLYQIRKLVSRSLASGENSSLLDAEAVAEECRDVICLAGSSCAGRKALGSLAEIFPAGKLYLELTARNTKNSRHLLESGTDLGLPICASNEVLYLNKEDHELYTLLQSIRHTTTLADKRFANSPTAGYHLAESSSMEYHFRDYPEALTNTLRISERCSLSLDLERLRLPVIAEDDPDRLLRERCLGGRTFQELQKQDSRDSREHNAKTLKTRSRRQLEHELAVIRERRLAPYFLIVGDLVEYARRCAIAVGPGRGSAGGSLVVYALGISRVNPLEHGLLFERFLSRGRRDMPDIDLDIDWRYRERLFGYLRRTYGPDRVAHAATLDTFRLRSAIRDAGRSLGFTPRELDRLSPYLPRLDHSSSEFRIEDYPHLANLVRGRERYRKLLGTALSLIGLPRHASIHAGAAIISPEPLTAFAPLQTSKHGQTIVQLDGNDCEALGLMKIDILGLRFLSVNADTRRSLRLRTGEPKIPFDDPKTYKLLQSGRTTGIFQLESTGMRRLLRKLQPGRLEDIIAVLSLYRPGPLRGGLVDSYIRRRHGEETVSFPHPALKKILDSTYGVLLYQEQVMLAAREIAGFDLSAADSLRRAMSKRKHAAMEELQTLFLKNASLPAREAKALFEQLAHFAGYGFNKAHAAAYAITSYTNAYYKCRHPLPFFTSLINNNLGYNSRLLRYLQEARLSGISILPVDINKSGYLFSTEGKAIRSGLFPVRYLGERIARRILRIRRVHGPFHSLRHFCELTGEHGLSIQALTALIQAGAFDFSPFNRRELLSLAPGTLKNSRPGKQTPGRAQLWLFPQARNEELCQAPADTRALPEELRLQMEMEALDIPVSAHPCRLLRPALEQAGASPIAEILSLRGNPRIRAGGFLFDPRKVSRENHESILFAVLQDESGEIPVAIPTRLLKPGLIGNSETKAFLLEGRLEIQPFEQSIRVESINFFK